jgi:hypothetical protein
MNNQKTNQTNTPIKEFNSTPIDTLSPVSLSDNLEPSKSLSEESLTIENSKSQPTSEPEILTESSTESLLEPGVEAKSTSEINPESKTELDQENEIIPMSEVESQPQPESKVEIKSEPNIEPKLDTEDTPDLVPKTQAETKPPSPITEDPEIVKQKIEEVLSYSTTNSTANSPSDKPKVSSFVKFLFTLSLLIFLGIAGAFCYFYFNPTSKKNSETKITPTTTPVQSNITCELNGFIYTLNQSFPSADGCNTCTCVSADNIECTKKDCSDVILAPATESAMVTPNVSTDSSIKIITPTIIKAENKD